MRKMVLAVFLLLPAPVVAAPPERTSGKMVLDGVADGLRGYRKAQTPAAKVTVLQQLYQSNDPRLAILLYSIVVDESEDKDVHYWAFHILARNFLIGKKQLFDPDHGVFQRDAW
jgi:hypothetical protein